MNPEEYLDRLIERHEHGELFIPLNNDDVATSMAAAEALVQLNEIRIPYSFTKSLELSIRARARSLTEQNLLSIPRTQTRNLTKHNLAVRSVRHVSSKVEPWLAYSGLLLC